LDIASYQARNDLNEDDEERQSIYPDSRPIVEGSGVLFPCVRRCSLHRRPVP